MDTVDTVHVLVVDVFDVLWPVEKEQDPDAVVVHELVDVVLDDQVPAMSTPDSGALLWSRAETVIVAVQLLLLPLRLVVPLAVARCTVGASVVLVVEDVVLLVVEDVVLPVVLLVLVVGPDAVAVAHPSIVAGLVTPSAKPTPEEGADRRKCSSMSVWMSCASLPATTFRAPLAA